MYIFLSFLITVEVYSNFFVRSRIFRIIASQKLMTLERRARNVRRFIRGKRIHVNAARHDLQGLTKVNTKYTMRLKVNCTVKYN